MTDHLKVRRSESEKRLNVVLHTVKYITSIETLRVTTMDYSEPPPRIWDDHGESTFENIAKWQQQQHPNNSDIVNTEIIFYSRLELIKTNFISVMILLKDSKLLRSFSRMKNLDLIAYLNKWNGNIHSNIHSIHSFVH